MNEIRAPRALQLPAPLARQIEAHAVRAYPTECCGILFGRESSSSPWPGPPEEGRGEGCIRIVERIQQVENVFKEAEQFHRFSIDPLTLMCAERDAADAGQLVLGFYHSHPDHPARPSDFDRSHAWPFYSYLIVSVQAGQAVDMTSWVLDDGSGTFLRQDILEVEPGNLDSTTT